MSEPDPQATGESDVEALAEKVAAELETGTYGDKVVLSRRQALAVMSGTATLGGILGFGTGSASAQSAGDTSVGNVGGAEEGPMDVWVDQLYDPGGNEFLNVDPGEPINAQFGREWVFDSASADAATIGEEHGGALPVLSNYRDGAPSALTIRPDEGDSVGSVELYPSGSGTRSHFIVGNTSDPDNSGAIKFEIDGDQGTLMSYSKGTATRPSSLNIDQFNGVTIFNDPNIGFSKDTTAQRLQILSTGQDYQLYDFEIGRSGMRTIIYDANGDARYLDGNGDWVLL